MNNLSKLQYPDFFRHIIHEISLIFNNRNSAYSLRYAGTDYSKKHHHDICVIQLVGKNIFAKLSATEIIENSHLLKEFSPEDIVTITKIRECIKNDTEKSSYKIHEINRQGDDEKNIFVIKKVGTKNMRRLSSKEIIEENILEKMNSDDSYEVGYIDGVKSISSLKEEMETARKEYQKNKGWRRFFTVK